MEEHNIREALVARVLTDLLEGEFLARIVERVRNHVDQLLKKIEAFAGWFLLSGKQDLGLHVPGEILLELVHGLIVFYLTVLRRDNRLVCLPHGLDRPWLLPLDLLAPRFCLLARAPGLRLLFFLLLLHQCDHLRPLVLVLDVRKALAWCRSWNIVHIAIFLDPLGDLDLLLNGELLIITLPSFLDHLAFVREALCCCPNPLLRPEPPNVSS
mmetsp:Transcript_75959/g.192137  ORF Transcript_75959/g.192137 Transcript_75959/m.192137 type:complete len:212 (-) Transcript_75959:12-647(-)